MSRPSRRPALPRTAPHYTVHHRTTATARFPPRRGPAVATLMSATLALCLALPAGATPTWIDADGSTDPALLIEAILGDKNVETPDCSHPEFGPHLGQQPDAELARPVFTFTLHATPDNDRCLFTDRQRLEIKASDTSPEAFRIRNGDTVHYRWRFRLDAGFQNSPGFTHLHQVRPYDGDAALPMIMLTTRLLDSDRVELNHVDSTGTQKLVAQAPFASLRGTWVEAESRLRAGSHGDYTLRLRRLSDGAVLLHRSFPDLDLWRKDMTFARPKWGLYRSLEFPQFLRDETVRYAGFCLAKDADECRPATQVAAPVFTPASGPQAGPVLVSLASATPGAVVRYRTDGQLPDCSSGTVFSAPVSISGAATLHAIACHDGMADSLGASAAYSFPAPGPVSLPRSAASASSNSDKAGNTLDGYLLTRWSASGDGQWIRYDLGHERTLTGVDIAWYKGGSRRYRFEVQVSADGNSFTPVFSGESSGKTTKREPYELPPTPARWVRIVGHGNSADGSIAITETV